MRELGHYILTDDHEIVATDLITWARWLEAAKVVVKQEDVGNYWVSTVFLGLDHNWGDGPPLLFETMVFCRTADGKLNFSELWCDRCSTWDEALIMHGRGCVWAKEQSSPLLIEGPAADN